MRRNYGALEHLERPLGLDECRTGQELVLGHQRRQVRNPIEEWTEHVRQVAALVFRQHAVRRREFVGERV